MNAGMDPSRLYTVLQKTDLRTKDPILYQLLYNLIGTIAKLNQTSSSSGGGGGGGSTSVVNIQNIITALGDVVENTEYLMIPGTSSAAVVSTYDSPLTNGDPLIPELIFDSFGDVVMVTGIPL